MSGVSVDGIGVIGLQLKAEVDDGDESLMMEKLKGVELRKDG